MKNLNSPFCINLQNSNLYEGAVGGGSNYANPVKTSGVSSTTASTTAAQQAPGLLKFYQILSDTTVRRTEVDQEDVKLYWKSDKR